MTKHSWMGRDQKSSHHELRRARPDLPLLAARIAPRSFVVFALGIANITGANGCKPFDRSRPLLEDEVKEEPQGPFTLIDVVSRNEDGAAERLRPNASFDGSFAFEVAGQPSCLGIRVAEEYLLSAASCVLDLQTALPRPAFLPEVLSSLVWQRGSEKIRATFVTRAVYPHQTFLDHLRRHSNSQRFVASESLNSVYDLALIRIFPEDGEDLPPLVTLAEQDPDAVTDAIALQGHCTGSDLSSKPALDGGRLLTAGNWEQGRVRNSFQDSFSNMRALYDCEGFLGAPVLSTAPEPILLGLTSWMQPGGLTRDVTRLTGSVNEKGTAAAWVAETMSNPPSYAQPQMNTEVGCTRSVVSAIGKFHLSIQPFELRLIDGLMEHADFQLEVEVTVGAPPKDQINTRSAPLIDPEEGNPRTFTAKLFRDIRQPSVLHYVPKEGEIFGDETVTVSLVSTDRRALLAIVSAINGNTKQERTLNIFFDELDPKWCLQRPLQAE